MSGTHFCRACNAICELEIDRVGGRSISQSIQKGVAASAESTLTLKNCELILFSNFQAKELILG